jgi:hypothetical protein
MPNGAKKKKPDDAAKPRKGEAVQSPLPKRTRALVADPAELVVKPGDREFVRVTNRSNRQVTIFPKITIGDRVLSVSPEAPQQLDPRASVQLEVERRDKTPGSRAGILKVRSTIGFFEIRVHGEASEASKRKTVNASVLKVAANQERGSEIWIARGTESGVGAGWYGELVRGGEPLVDGTFRIHTAHGRQSIAKVSAPADQIDKTVYVRLSPVEIAPKHIAGKLDSHTSRCEDGQTDAGCWLPQTARDNLQNTIGNRIGAALGNAHGALADLRTDEKLRRAAAAALERAALLDIIFALAPPLVGGALKGVVSHLAASNALRVIVEGTPKAAEPYWKAAVSGASTAAKRVARTVTAPEPSRELDFVNHLERWVDAVRDQLQLSIQHRADDELLALYELYDPTRHPKDLYRRQFRQKLESYRANVGLIGERERTVGEGIVRRTQEMRVVRVLSKQGTTRIALCRYMFDGPLALSTRLLRFEASPTGHYWFVRWVPEEFEDSAVAEQTARVGGVHTLPIYHTRFECAPENLREFLPWIEWSQSARPGAPRRSRTP